VEEKLDDLHLADLHALAARLAVPRFRMLRRPQLVSEIESRRGTSGEALDAPTVRAPAPVDASEAETPPEGTPAVAAKPERERERLETTQTQDVTGVVEITPQRYGFLRVHGLGPDPDDVYISASQIRRCELRPGDEISGPARAPRRGERHRALVHVDQVDTEGPPAVGRPEFDQLTPILPKRRLPLDRGPVDVLTRAVDLLVPIALGQRVLVRAGPRSGRTTLLRGLARAFEAADGVELIVLLIDERPEEATGWREALADAEIAGATAELAPADQLRVAGLALERARRRVEAGADVVLIVDSLSRLAVAAQSAEGRGASADAEVKRLFGSGRELAEEGAGSLTVVATVVEGAEDDGAAERAVITTESALIRLDPELAARGVFPALRVADCRASNEEELREPQELAAVRRLRSMLDALDPAEAAGLLRERIEHSPTSAALLGEL
jgi:transcription termination factor Rho